jgi:hypothetical protein
MGQVLRGHISPIPSNLYRIGVFRVRIKWVWLILIMQLNSLIPMLSKVSNKHELYLIVSFIQNLRNQSTWKQSTKWPDTSKRMKSKMLIISARNLGVITLPPKTERPPTDLGSPSRTIHKHTFHRTTHPTSEFLCNRTNNCMNSSLVLKKASNTTELSGSLRSF